MDSYLQNGVSDSELVPGCSSILQSMLNMVKSTTSEMGGVHGSSSPAGSSSTPAGQQTNYYNPSPGTSTSAEASEIHPQGKGAKKNIFQVNTNLIHSVPSGEQASELQGLGLEVYNQDTFEQGIMEQVDKALETEENERMKKILQKELKTVEEGVKMTKLELREISNKLSMLTKPSLINKEAFRQLRSVQAHQDNKTKQLKKLTSKQKSLALKINGNLNALGESDNQGDEQSNILEQALGLNSAAGETEQERMVRLGEMTPFGTVINSQSDNDKACASKKLSTPSTRTDFEKFLMGPSSSRKSSRPPSSKGSHSKLKISNTSATLSKASQSNSDGTPSNKLKKSASDTKFKSAAKSKESNFEEINKHQTYVRGNSNLFDSKHKKAHYGVTGKDSSYCRANKRRIYPKLQHNFSEDRELSDFEVGDENDDDDYYNDDDGDDDDKEYVPSDRDVYDDNDEDSYEPVKKKPRPARQKDDSFKSLKCKEDQSEYDLKQVKGQYKKKASSSHVIHGKDDGNLSHFEDRLSLYHRQFAKRQKSKRGAETDSDSGSDMEFDGGYKVPAGIWKKLYRYQKTGVRWLWELHLQQAGGIIGDEMGMGKTIQIIAYLTGLRFSKVVDKAENTRYRGLGPTIIVCPTTVMHQWVREFHTWSPEFRVAVLHNSGNYSGSEDELIKSVVRRKDILVTSYSGVTIHQDLLLPHNWHYIILDEGHKIRNPDAQVTLACKQFRTSHRLILSGSPMQNNLKELWSLFDFVFPGKLGTLPDFMSHFSIPIVQGGYSNATEVQVQTAYKCACVLRDTISPYLLRRMKSDVKETLSLPEKNEQVLFCRITDHQREVYKEYLDSKECSMILGQSYLVFPGLITLRKVCNHPDLSTGGPLVFNAEERASSEDMEYGFWKRSGKMIVVASLLQLWKKQDHRVLLFTQSRQMMEVLEHFVKTHGYQYLTMDGGTPISQRQSLISKFNEDASYFIFILTTRVGGLGVNLTGADRVVIYDPDWNPSTDLQARERAWRIGQKRQVTIYRLLTAGTIEEKIYHRQIFKQFLTNRVLKDPKQRRFFKSNDLYELFTLGDDNAKSGTETSALFAGTGSDVKIKPKKTCSNAEGRKNRFDELRKREKEIVIEDKECLDKEQLEEEGEESVVLDAKLAKMRELAKKLSKQIGNSTLKTDPATSTCVKAEDEVSGLNLNSVSTIKGADVNKEKASSTRKDKKKKKKRKDAELEGEKIAYLKKHKAYVPSVEVESNSSKKDDEYVLEKLFKKSGVHSAIQHDKIMMSSNPDYALVEGEADRVAREAAKALKQSRARCYAAGSGIPTWTGQHGQTSGSSRPRFGQKKNSKLVDTSAVVAKPKKPSHIEKTPVKASPKPTPKHFDGTIAGNRMSSGVVSSSAPDMMSSKELLSRMQSRNHLILSKQAGGDEDIDEAYLGRVSTSANIEENELELITDIRNVVAFGCAIDGQATTQELLEVFNTRLPKEDTAKFKAMLKQICDFDKINGMGFWRLKSEFR